jgi:hypothetical protein
MILKIRAHFESNLRDQALRRLGEGLNARRVTKRFLKGWSQEGCGQAAFG